MVTMPPVPLVASGTHTGLKTGFKALLKTLHVRESTGMAVVAMLAALGPMRALGGSKLGHGAGHLLRRLRGLLGSLRSILSQNREGRKEGGNK